MTLEQWSVGGRGFGGLLVFLLTAGEIYTTFTFLGGSGWAYGRGAPTILHPRLRFARLRDVLLAAAADLALRQARAAAVASRTSSATSTTARGWALLVAAVGVVALVPYLVLQFQGLGIIVSVASYGAISPTLAIWIGAATVTIYVMISGMHGVRGTPRSRTR